MFHSTTSLYIFAFKDSPNFAFKAHTFVVDRSISTRFRKWRRESSLARALSSPTTSYHALQQLFLPLVFTYHHQPTAVSVVSFSPSPPPPPLVDLVLKKLLHESLSPSSFGSDARSNHQPNVKREDIMLDGCDFEHLLIMMEKPEDEPSGEDIIDFCIKTLAKMVGSEEEARMKIYSVSTKHYYAFSCLLPGEVAEKLNGLPGVSWVLPDAYVDFKNKDYGGEPFINGEAVPYDPKYHEEWVRNNSRAKEKTIKADKPKGGNRNRPPAARNSASKEKNAGPGSPDGGRAF